MSSPATSAAQVPIAFFVIGPAGSGKSTVSRFLAKRYRTAYLDKDAVATAFTEALLAATGNDPHERDNNAYYQHHVLPLEYSTLLRVCGDNLRVGTSVVLDAPFGRFLPDERFLLDAATTHGWPAEAKLVVAHVRTDGDAVLGRLRERGLQRDGWKIEHWSQFWPAATATTCGWLGATHVVIDNSGAEPDVSELETRLHEAVLLR